MALLRGVNVGGKNKLPMRDLAALFAKAGAEEAETFIQSGNVVFRARPGVAARLAETVAAAIFERYGHRPPILTRTVAELAELVRANPFAKAGVDPATLHVAFLRDPPSAERVAALDAARSPPDQFLVRKREIYLRLPNGVARTRLTNAWFDSALATTATLRNWHTVQRLLELAGHREPGAPRRAPVTGARASRSQPALMPTAAREGGGPGARSLPCTGRAPD